MSTVPTDLIYSKQHEWVRVECDEAVIGITDHAQEELGEIVYLELPEVGRILKQDEVFGTVESVKAVSDLYCPTSGEVVGAHTEITDATETVNDDPYGEGWLIRVRMTVPSDIEALMSADAYDALIRESDA
jgi:glycine cleavage system H protein